MNTKYESIIMAGIVADAFGVPFENHIYGGQAEMTGHLAHNQPAGTWSDDTSMTLATMDWINNNLLSGDELMHRFDDFFAKDAYTSGGKMFDIGGTVRESILRFEEGTPSLSCGDDWGYSNGNGALMRLAPVAIFLHKNPDVEITSFVKHTTMLTHAHRTSLICSEFYVRLLMGLLDRAGFWFALRAACKATALSYSLSDKNELYKLSRYSEYDFDNKPFGGTYVLDTLRSAIWLNENSSSYQELVQNACEMGGDTDTIAQIAATIWSCSDNVETVIPFFWCRDLQMTSEAREIIEEFCKD